MHAEQMTCKWVFGFDWWCSFFAFSPRLTITIGYLFSSLHSENEISLLIFKLYGFLGSELYKLLLQTTALGISTCCWECKIWWVHRGDQAGLTDQTETLQVDLLRAEEVNMFCRSVNSSSFSSTSLDQTITALGEGGGSEKVEGVSKGLVQVMLILHSEYPNDMRLRIERDASTLHVSQILALWYILTCSIRS